MANEKKFLDSSGIGHLWDRIEERYPNMDELGLIIDAIDEVKANKTDIVQADWNQNDETAVDYIKNRTHWSEGITVVEIYPEATIQITDDEVLLSETEPIGLVVDDNYVVTYNGTDYTCTAIDASIFMNGMPATAIGNVGLEFGTGDSGEPFIIVELSPEVAAAIGAYAMMIDLSGSTEVTVGITHLQETVHKIPNKYLPKVTMPKNIIDGKSLGSLRTLGANAVSEIGQFAFAEGNDTTASGDSSHAEGLNATASGNYSHAEGQSTTASGISSHAEGCGTTASGPFSHAEGYYTTASGQNSHAEGQITTASGLYSHAEGSYTIASSGNQHVQGKYNIEDKSGTYAHIVGNGTSTNNRSNAHTLDWNGNAWFKGKITLGNDNKEVAIKDDIAALSELIADPDWNINDSNNPAYIKNRTHYIERKPSTEIFPETVLSDNVLSSDAPIGIVSGEIYIVKFNNSLYTCQASQVVIDSLNCIAIGNLGIIESGIDSGQPFCIIELSDEETAKLLGYDIILLQDGISTPTVGIYESEEYVHKLYGKYMPDGYPYIDQIEVLPETTITLDEYDSAGPLVNTLDITPGNSYTVIWNDVEYAVTAQEMTQEAVSGIILGNLGAVMGTGDTGEPFVVLYAPDMYVDLGFTGIVMAISGTGATEAKIAIYGGNGEIHTMDPRFIPDMYYEENLGKTYLSYSGTLLRENETELKVEVETPSVNIDADLAYTVTFNGVQYPDIVGTPSEIDGTPIIEFRITLDNGDEVSIQTINGMGFMIAVSEATPTHVETYDCVCTVETVDMLIHKIDKKYLPDDVGGSSIKNLEDGSSHGSIRMIDSAVENNDYTMGESAFAEGYQTKASGDYSHAEGIGTEASGYSSHAEGSNNTASGKFSHVEGGFNTASGEESHAEGSGTTASGDHSHTEGQSTTASGISSHAEGQGSVAKGGRSHAEGYYTTASGDYQHVQGKFNIEDTKNKYAHIVGNGTNSVKSNAHTLDWNGNAWFAGKITLGPDNKELSTVGRDVEGVAFPLTSTSSVIANIGAEIFNDYIHNRAIGKYSHAEGRKTFAKGSIAHAEGSETTASGSAAHAEGSETFATGSDSHAEGNGTKAIGNYSHAEGSKNHTTININLTGAAGSSQYTLQSENSWNFAHISTGLVLNYDTTYAIITTIDKPTLTITLDKSLSSSALNNEVVTIVSAVAYGDGSHVEGYSNTAIGNYSHAEGFHVEARGNASHAEGNSTTASGNDSHAEGVATTSSGSSSHAEGNNTTASGEASHTEGYHTMALSNYQHVQGKWNIRDTSNTYAHIVGNGTADDARFNAHTLDWNGNAWFQGDVYINSTSGKNKDEGSKKLATEEYVDEQLNSASSSKLISHVLPIEATEENQTIFPINLETFDAANDTVLVQDGITLLLPNSGFTIENNTIVMTTPWGLGDTGSILILKNTPVLADEATISGAIIENNSITLDKLSADITTELDEIKKSASDGKALVAGAITDKGIETAADATFETMANNINSITTLDSAPSLEAAEITPGASDQVIAAGNYLKGDQTIKGDANLVAANIAKGKSIFGVTGTYDPAASAWNTIYTNLETSLDPLLVNIRSGGSTYVNIGNYKNSTDVNIALKVPRSTSSTNVTSTQTVPYGYYLIYIGYSALNNTTLCKEALNAWMADSSNYSGATLICTGTDDDYGGTYGVYTTLLVKAASSWTIKPTSYEYTKLSYKRVI